MQTLFNNTYKQDARMFDDIMKARKSANNQLRILTKATDEPDEDGVCRGKGMPEFSPSVQTLLHHIERLEVSEREAKLCLEKNFKSSPFKTLAGEHSPNKINYGLGVPMLAQLVGVIGDPYIKPQQVDIETKTITEEARVRTLSELFSFCGLTPTGIRKKGQKCNYSPAAKSIVWNIGEAIKRVPEDTDTYFRNMWLFWKNEYKNRVDENGKAWNGIRAMRAAHRKVGREVLKMLYFEAEAYHLGWAKSRYEYDEAFLPKT